MQRQTRFLWALSATTLLVYLVMAFISIPAVQRQAGGLLPFDLRPFGYGEAEARAFLQDLSEQGRSYYLTVQHGLDTLFPVLNGLLVFMLLARWLPHVNAVLFAVLALAVTGFDWLENILVHVMLRQGSAATAGLIQAASLATMAKSLAVAVAYSLVIYAFIADLRRAKPPETP